MPPLITFIGWHNSGKTTFICEVIRHLTSRGFRVGVIKSSKEKGIRFDTSGTDTDRLAMAGADGVAFVAPDQAVTLGKNRGLSLPVMAHRFFPDMDLVIGEGFKNADDVDKIEVTGGRDGQNLREEDSGVVAVVTDGPAEGFPRFRPDEHGRLADFLEEHYILKNRYLASTFLAVNGKKISLTGFLQDCLAGTVHGFVSSLRNTDGAELIEISITIPKGNRK